MRATINVNNQASLDQLIFDNKKFEFIKQYRDIYVCSLKEALEALSTRYAQLRQEYPDAFSESDSEYWEGFYS